MSKDRMRTFVMNLKTEQGYGIVIDIPAKSEEEARAKLDGLTSEESEFDFLVNGEEVIHGRVYLYPHELREQAFFDEMEHEDEDAA